MRNPSIVAFNFTIDEPLGTVLTAFRQLLPRDASEPEMFRETAPNHPVERLTTEGDGAAAGALQQALPGVRLARTEDGQLLGDYLARARSFSFVREGRGDVITLTAPSHSSAPGTTSVHVGIAVVGLAATACSLPGFRRSVRRECETWPARTVSDFVAERATLRVARQGIS